LLLNPGQRHMDLTEIAESLRRGVQEVPPIVIALALLAGPTFVLIIYGLFSVARRMQGSSENVKATAFWVCRDCRSINEMRLARCYHCALPRTSTREVEVLIDRPGYRPVPLVLPVEAPSTAPAASASATPVASLARAAKGRKSAGTPVMGQAADVDPVAVGPGHEAGVDQGVAPTKEESGAAVEAES
jgi:hypothetical protein